MKKSLLMIIPINKTAGRVLCGLFTFLLTLGCDVYTTQKCPSYVVCYNNLRSIKLSALESDSKGVIINCGNDIPVKTFHLYSTGEEKETYDWLCNKHHDLTYNEYRTFMKDLPSESVTFNDKDFVSIDIISDTDFDVNHSAGDNLADIVRFISWSPYKYIRSGYREYYHYSPGSLSNTFESVMPIYWGREYTQTESTCHPVDKMVSELSSDDLILLGHDHPGMIGILVFEVLPTNRGAQNITVRMTTDAGMTLEDVITLTF